MLCNAPMVDVPCPLGRPKRRSALDLTLRRCLPILGGQVHHHPHFEIHGLPVDLWFVGQCVPALAITSPHPKRLCLWPCEGLGSPHHATYPQAATFNSAEAVKKLLGQGVTVPNPRLHAQARAAFDLKQAPTTTSEEKGESRLTARRKGVPLKSQDVPASAIISTSVSIVGKRPSWWLWSGLRVASVLQDRRRALPIILSGRNGSWISWSSTGEEKASRFAVLCGGPTTQAALVTCHSTLEMSTPVPPAKKVACRGPWAATGWT